MRREVFFPVWLFTTNARHFRLSGADSFEENLNNSSQQKRKFTISWFEQLLCFVRLQNDSSPFLGLSTNCVSLDIK